MVWAIIVEVIVEYIAYIYLAAVFIYSNNQSRLMAHRARRAAAAARIGEDRKNMVKQPITSHKILYGQALISGPITFAHVTDNNLYQHYLVTLTAHEVAAIHDIYLNDEIIKFDEDGRVIGKYANVLVIKKGLGNAADDAALHAYMTAQFPAEWTSAHRQTGCAKLYARLKFDMDLFPTGIPNIAAVVTGKKVFDPRTNTTGYSNNPALCIRDYLINAQHGLGGGEYVHNGTAQAAGSATLTLASSASAVDNAYQHMTVRITGGAGIGQQRPIVSYVGATKIATVVSAWDVTPGITSTYSITAPSEDVNDSTLGTTASICDEMMTLAGQANTFVTDPVITDPGNNPIRQKFESIYVTDGTLYGSNYTYAFTFLSATGETKLSPDSDYFAAGRFAASVSVTTGIGLRNIPLGTGSVTGRKIYRSSGAGYFLAGTIPDNVTTTFDDAGTVGAAAPTVNTTGQSDVLLRSSVSPYLQTGDGVQVSTTGTLPAGLAAATTYYYIYTSMDSGKLATTRANAFAGTAVNITDAGSGTHTNTKVSEPRYTCDGMVDTDETPKSILGTLLTSCGGRLIYTGGQWQLQAAAYLATSGTIDESELDGPIRLQTLVGKRDLCNGVKGVFVNPANNWQPTDFPPVTNSTYTASDNYERLWRDMQLPFTVSPSMSQRLAKIELEKVRQQITTVWPCKLTALRFQAGDTVSLTNTRFGWSAKVFEIIDFRMVLRENDGVPRLGIDLTMRETAAAIYDWNSGEETTVDLAANTNLPDATSVSAPGTLSAASGTDHLFLRSDGTVFTRVYVSWSAITDQYVLSSGHIEIEYRRTDSTNPEWEKGPTVPGTETSAYILDVEDGISYYIRARSINGIGVRSAWSLVLHLVIGKTAAPANVTGFSASQNGAVVVLRWDQVADVDLSGYEIRYITQGGTNWDGATPLTRVTRGTQITTAGLPPGQWTLLIKARDTSENYSAAAATYAIDMTNAFDVVQTMADEPDFLGTKTNFVHHWTGYLVPDSQDLASVDSWNTFDQFVPNPQVTCSYVAYADMSIAFADTIRVWADMAATLGPGETSGFPNPTLEIDYHSGAGFDGYEPWTIGTILAQFVRPKLVLLTSDGVAYVSRFKNTADIESHTETGVGVVVGASGTAITFTDRYHSAPSIQITVAGASLYAGFTAASGSGFTAHVYNAAGTEVGGTINWTADGE